MGNADKFYKHLNKIKRLKLLKVTNQNLFSNKLGYSVDPTGDVIGLNLSGQRIKDISFLKDYNTIQFLDLSHNMISDISILSNLKNLLRLDISYNEISDITCLRELKMLKWVKIENIKLSSIPLDILDWNINIEWGDCSVSGTLLNKGILKTKPYEDLFSRNILDIVRLNSTKNEMNLPPNHPKIKKKILVVAANPYFQNGNTSLNLDIELREIQEIIQISKNWEEFDFNSRLALRPLDFQKTLLRLKPNIVQFIGHGTKEGLIIQDDNGQPIILTPEALSRLFELFSHHVECVILNACYSASIAEAIGEYIEFSIGMREQIMDKTAIKFSVGFYNALVEGRSYQDAFHFGNISIRNHYPEQKEHLIPVLFSKQKEKA